MAKTDWAAALRKWRNRASLTYQKAADGLGVSIYIYRRWELGETEPTASAIGRMPSTFNVDREDVLSLVEDVRTAG